MRCQSLLSGLLVGFLLAASPLLAQQEYSREERSHWSLLPRRRVEVPQFSRPEDAHWVREPIDAFVLQQLRQRGLRPAPEASRQVLIRRLYFYLLGLPPSPAEISDFLADSSPDAYEQLVDRLLASPHFGERWAQHWLDVVRFAETEGFEYDRHRAGAWRYRDCVIDSFNRDKPFDRFIREQLAGDEMQDELERESPQAQRAAWIAAGFHRLGPVRRNAGNAEVAFSRNEVLTEMTDAVGTVFLGLTLGCARCHDHMFDPIRQTDYYQLQAFLAATFEHDITLASQQRQRQWKARDDAAQAEIARIKKALEDTGGDERERLQGELRAAQDRIPDPLPTISTVRNEATQRTSIYLLERGEPDQKKQRLGMRVPGVLLPEGAPQLPADTQRPKRELADWITDPGNPLTARVLVNRIWQHHFGQGLVSTANDFGCNGDAPSHPELLDYLANQLIDDGWQIKSLCRTILLSSAFRQSSQSPDRAEAHQLDPKNRLLWRFARRRLEAEQIRDAMLAISGRLNRQMGGPSVMIPVDAELIGLLYKPTQWQVTRNRKRHDCRSIYLIAKRNLRLPFMDVFDQPDLQRTCAARESSTHAPQCLELLNGQLSNELARCFAERLRRQAGSDPRQQVELAFLLATGRRPDPNEQKLAVAFLKQNPLQEFALAMFNLNTFLYVD